MKLNRLIGLVLVLGLLLPLAVSCGPKKAELGTEDNPIIWAFVPSGEMERVAAGAESVADLLNKETSLVIKTNVATKYAGVIEAMCSDPPEAHMASLATFAYVLAHERKCAEAELVSVRFGSPTYNGQIIVRADSGITSIADLKARPSVGPTRSPLSGWIIPMLTMCACLNFLSIILILPPPVFHQIVLVHGFYVRHKKPLPTKRLVISSNKGWLASKGRGLFCLAFDCFDYR